MTGDAFTGRKNHGKGHTYYIDGQKVPGVTSILSQGLPKPALVNWAARTAAELAINEWDQLAELPVADRLTRISKAPEASRNAAAVRGTRVHALAEQLAAGDRVNVPDDIAGHVDACKKFLDDWQVRTVMTEVPVISRQWRYGGTLDMVAEFEGKQWLLDWKTNKSGPFGDVAFQLAAYRYADTWLYPPETGLRGHCPIDECGVVWLRADGYSLHPYHADEGVFRQFLYIMQCAKAAEDCRDYRGDALYTPTGATP